MQGDPVLDGVTQGFLERGILGLICIALSYVIVKLWTRYENRLEAQSTANKEAIIEIDRLHREALAEKDREIVRLNQEIKQEIKVIYTVVDKQNKTFAELASAIQKGKS